MPNQTKSRALGALNVLLPSADPEMRQRTGSVSIDPGRSFADIIADINAGLSDLGIAPGESGFNDRSWMDPSMPTSMPDESGWVTCIPVRGGSEGHYLHLEWHARTGTRTWFGTAKTFDQTNAWQVANAVMMLVDG